MTPGLQASASFSDRGVWRSVFGPVDWWSARSVRPGGELADLSVSPSLAHPGRNCHIGRGAMWRQNVQLHASSSLAGTFCIPFSIRPAFSEMGWQCSFIAEGSIAIRRATTRSALRLRAMERARHWTAPGRAMRRSAAASHPRPTRALETNKKISRGTCPSPGWRWKPTCAVQVAVGGGAWALLERCRRIVPVLEPAVRRCGASPTAGRGGGGPIGVCSLAASPSARARYQRSLWAWTVHCSLIRPVSRASRRAARPGIGHPQQAAGGVAKRSGGCSAAGGGGRPGWAGRR